MTENTHTLEATKSLRAFTSKVTFSNTLISAPTIYDLAPEYLLQEYKSGVKDLECKISNRIQNQEINDISNRSLSKDVKIALQHIAPIGLNVVRLGAIGMMIASMSNPVGLILGVPALLMTGKNTLNNLKRAFTSDPKIRELVQKAGEYEKRGDFENAENILKDALDINVNSDNPRNGDIYFQMALVNLKTRSPRKALINLSKASVLFKEDDKLTMEKGDGTKISISKRGYTELLACAAIDSFMISDPSGLKEWQETSKDFSRSAIKRFEYYSDKKESGLLFGLMGKDEQSADANKALIAKVKFLQAKVDAKRILGSNEKKKIHPALQEGVNLILEDTTLTDEERAMAFLEQAQFYYSASTKSSETSIEMVLSALMLTKAAADINGRTDREKQILTMAESISFLIDFVPKLKVENPAQKEEITVIIKKELEDLLKIMETLNLSEKDTYILWAYDKLYKLSSSPDEKLNYIDRSISLAKEKGSLVSLFYSNLRKTFLKKDASSISDLMNAAEEIIKSDEVNLKAYGYKYKAEMLANKNRAESTFLFEKAGDLFKHAAQECRESKNFTPFMVQGHPVLHSWKESCFVYLTLSAYCFIKSKSVDKLREIILLAESAIFSLEKPENQGIIKTLKASLRAMEGDLSSAELYLKDAVGIFSAEGKKDLLIWAKGIMQRNEVEKLTTIENKTTSNALSDSLEIKRIEDYERIKSKILDLFLRIKSLYDAEDKNSLNYVESLENKLRECRFTIAVVGEFSTGKSTFINALLGEKVLPSAARPTTSAVNLIKYSEEKFAIVNFQNKPSERISIEDLRKFITEKFNPENEKCVRNVEIYYPLDLLKNGIVILDTPGLGSLHREHQEVTYSVLPSSDAVILLTTSAQPYSESTNLFLVDLKNEIGEKIFFILNMIDTLNQGGLLEQQNFIKTNAGKIINEIRLYPVSSYFALVGKGIRDGFINPEDYKDNEMTGGITDPEILLQNSRFGDLEKDLFEYLVGNKGKIVLENINVSTEKLLKEARTHRKMMITSFEKDLSVVRSDCDSLAKKAQETQKKFDFLLTNLSNDLKDIQQNMLETINDESGKLKSNILNYIDSHDINILKESGAEKIISNELDSWVREISRKPVDEIEKTLDIAIHEINKISTGFYDEFYDVFKNDEPGSPPRINVSDIQIGTQGFLDFAGSFGIGILSAMLIGGPVAILVALLGGPVFSSFLQSKRNEKAKNQLKESIEKEFADIVNKIKDSVRENLSEVSRKAIKSLKDHCDFIISKKEEEIRNIIGIRESKEQEVLPLKKKLSVELDEIKEIQGNLSSIFKNGDA